MRKAFIAAVFAAMSLASVSCTLTDILKFDYDINDPWSSWEKVEPGVYLGTDDSFNKGEIIAKGTDNSMICGNVDGNYVIVPTKFVAFDGVNTTYEFGYSSYRDKKVLSCIIDVMSDNPSKDMMAFSANVEATKKLWGARCSGLCSFPSKYKKIAKGGDMLANYKTICDKYQKELPYTEPSKQLITSYTDFRGNWLTGKYPTDMDAKSWVIPYKGPGRLESCTVCRQLGWDDRGNRKVFYGGCQFENVTWVEARVSGVTYGEALDYVSTVKASGHYNVVIEDSAIDGKAISFKADSNDKAENTEGYSGYICPCYEISFTDLLGTSTLTIKFGVGYTTFV